jgi:phosphoribosylamine--glycine ligase
MGAYSPAPVLTDELYKRVMREVIAPTVKGMADEGAPTQVFVCRANDP